MRVWELRKILQDDKLSNNAEIKIIDGIGDTFRTIDATFNKEKGTVLTIRVADIIF